MIKIGVVGYLNTLPIFYRWTTKDVLFVKDHPSKLVEYLREGKIHAGIVSSAEYLIHGEQYIIVPNISISSKERACSVLIFSKKPLEKVDTLYLTPASLTSRLLALYVLREVYRREPQIVKDKSHAEAVMLIGDEALRERFSNAWLYVYDLGSEWFHLHGLPFVFALFLVRKDAPPELVSLIERECSRSKEVFFQELKAHRIKLQGYSQEFLEGYFTSCLDYNLGSEELKSLEIFKEILIKGGLSLKR
ncbi:MAG: menaquinone biosynthesis protein [Aquificaceae bacterium]|nr:menaquinone biosynthesis protein [Aquificaceae bacterium]MDW8423130.1 menaquinone biosynthesis protein [Aquificaceae bacterium]